MPRITAANKPPVKPNPLANSSPLNLPDGISPRLAAAVMLRAEVCVFPLAGKVTLAGFNEQEILTGAALAQARLMVPAKPLSSVTVIVEVPACPAAADVTNPSSAKSGAGVTASHAEIRLATSSDPSPVTWSYPAPAGNPKLVVPAGQFVVPEVHGALLFPDVMS